MNKKLLDVIKKRFAGSTQKQIAAVCEMPESDVSLIWTGKRNLTVETLIKLCNGLGVDCWEIWKEAEND